MYFRRSPCRYLLYALFDILLLKGENMRKICRLLFSRITLSLVFIVAEVVLMGLLYSYAYSYYAVIGFLARVISFAVLISLINEDTNPEFKLTWLATVLLLPLFGAVLYIIFSKRRTTKRETAFLMKIGGSFEASARENGELTASAQMLGELSRSSFTLGGIAHSLMADDPLARLYREEDIKYFPSGEELYRDMLSSLELAEKYIFLEYFVIEEGKMWQGIYEILKRKAKEGLDVRVLYDDMGTICTLPYGFEKRLRADGIRAERFSKVTPTLTSSHNNRDHRKITVVDGVIAYTGGVNIADEYINEVQKYGHWKDGGVRVSGAAAMGFARLFLSLYDMTARTLSDYGAFFDASSELAPFYLKDKKEKNGFVLPIGTGPMPFYKNQVGKSALMNIIGSAKRYVYLTTPYLIIDYDLTEALRAAAKRGVDVRVITPGVADKKFIKIMTKSTYPTLCKDGVRIFEYSPGFIHEKLAVADDAVAMIGTVNLDYRSLVHHFEDALIIFLSDEIKSITDGVMKTLSSSCEICLADAKLNLFEKIVQGLSRIFFPLL